MAHKSSVQTDKTTAFISQFTPAKANGNASHTTIGHEQKESARQALPIMQMPGTRWESWKYTSLKSILEPSFQLASRREISTVANWEIPGLDACKMVFINGIFDATLSDAMQEENVTCTPWSNLSGSEKETFEKHYGSVIPADKDIFTALNTAYSEEGLFIHVSRNTVCKKPIHIIQLSDVSSPTAMQVRNLVVVEESAEVKIIETFYSLSDEITLRNQVVEIVVAQNANCEYIKVQSESMDASMIDNTQIRQAKDSNASIFTLTFGGSLVRNNLQFNLEEAHTESNLMGLYMLTGNQHVDNHSLVNHKKPNSYSNELYKGIVTGRSTGVFNGKIHVFQEAQKTNAFQSNRNILLSDTSNVYTQPQLEIYADDVKCSHGATTGRIDEDSLFYLRARGIPEMDAKKLLVQAFAGEVIQQISLEPVQDYLEEKIQHRFD